MTLPTHCDLLVIGAGIVGLTVAATWKRIHGGSVLVVEKEADLAAHASGRNSGVLHAGFYYPEDSLKARFCRDGNRRWREWCLERDLPMRPTGKLVVARSEADLPAMDTMLQRGQRNGVTLHVVSESEALEIEPRAKTFQQALWSPDTAVVDPAALVRSVAAEFEAAGGQLALGTAYVGRSNDGVVTTHGTVSAGHVVNAAGVHADTVAKHFGFGTGYRMMPFKGLYLYGDEPEGSFRTAIYPVPDLGMPFLGVHLTVTVTGAAKLGPTAMPVFGREHYQGITGLSVDDVATVLPRQAGMFLRDPSFRRLAVTELQKAWGSRLLDDATLLVRGLDPSQWKQWGRPGIRAQLYSIKKQALEMDFVVEGDGHSTHVLNAVSPALTCAWPFAEHVVEEIARR